MDSLELQHVTVITDERSLRTRIQCIARVQSASDAALGSAISFAQAFESSDDPAHHSCFGFSFCSSLGGAAGRCAGFAAGGGLAGFRASGFAVS
jgi:hypothetical protein